VPVELKELVSANARLTSVSASLSLSVSSQFGVPMIEFGDGRSSHQEGDHYRTS